MLNPTCLYCSGTELKLDCGTFNTIIVPADEVESYLLDGWFRHPTHVSQADNSIPNRAELEAQAKELGISFGGKISNAKLYERISDFMKSQENNGDNSVVE